jgi:hypothetical protein
MDKEQVKKVIKLNNNIEKTAEEVRLLNGVPFDTGYCAIGNHLIPADENLLSQIIRLAVNYKEEQIKSWQKELDNM